MTMKIHPYCDSFPDLPDEELKKLAQDIKDNGLSNPIWRTKDGKILDGKNRLKACEIAGVKPDFREWTTRSTDPLKIDDEIFHFVLSQNELRRHLDQSQRSMAAAKLAIEYEKTHPPQKIEKADKAGTNGEKGKEDEEHPPEPPKTTLAMAAELMGVSERSVDMASRVVKKGSTGLQEAVERGDVAVSDAAAVAVLDKGDQNEALAAVRQEKAPNLRKAAGKKLKRTKAKPAAAGEFDDSEFEEHFGALVRFLNNRVKKFPNKAMHKTCINRLDTVSKAFKEWRVMRK